MPEMTDPTLAMVSFQRAVLNGSVQPQETTSHPGVYVYRDPLPTGGLRFTYARLKDRRVVAFANFVPAGFENEIPVFQVGVAVPLAERGKGLAKHILAAGIAELKQGFGRSRPGAMIYIEAVVGLDNLASQHVAAATISPDPKPIRDEVSGLPALHYLRKF